MGLWSALSIGRSAIQASQLGLEIAGHNIANAATGGYARQRAVLAAGRARPATDGMLAGTGVNVAAIQALVDAQLEERMRAAAGEAGDLGVRHAYLARVEGIINELRDDDLSTAINEFFNAMEDLQASPADAGLRGIAVQRAQNLADTFTRTRARLDGTRLEVDGKVVAAVGEINRLTQEIAALNGRIVEQEQGGAGGPANDLRSRRAALLTDLARLAGTRVIETPKGSVNVFLGNQLIVQDQRVRQLRAEVTADRGVAVSNVIFADDGSAVSLVGGELSGLVASRDQVIGGLVNDLDRLAAALIWNVNRVHSVGRGLAPLAALTAAVAVGDPDVTLNAAGLPFSPTHGRFNVTVIERQTGVGTTTTIDVDLDGLGTDATLNDIAAALDAVDGLRASVDSRGRLVVEAETGNTAFVFGDDTSGLLAALGLNTLFSGSDSRTIGVMADVAADPSRLAAARSGDTYDASNLVAMLEVRSMPLSGLDGLTLGEFLETSTTTLAIQTASAADASSAAGTFLGALRAERESHSGVSLDEETLDLIRFQRTFQAAARLVAAVDELMRLLLSM